jgi:hypothetical protein
MIAAAPTASLAAELPPLPAGLAADLRITLLADRDRAADAAELAALYTAGTLSWETGYPWYAHEPDPQAAAAEHALADAADLASLYHTALARATGTGRQDRAA